MPEKRKARNKIALLFAIMLLPPVFYYSLWEPETAIAFEVRAYITSLCSDLVDNDSDGLTDYPLDPGCASSLDHVENDDRPACSDGVDNDSDGRIDYQSDTGCDNNASSTDETDPVEEEPEATSTDSGTGSSTSSGGGGIPSYIARFIRNLLDSDGSKEQEGLYKDEKVARLGSDTPDFNKDGRVDIVDFSILLHRYGVFVAANDSNRDYDLNKDGRVDLADVSIILYYWV